MTRLHEEYRSRIIPELKASLGKSNIHAVPRLQKIVVSMGVGEAVNDLARRVGRRKEGEPCKHIKTRITRLSHTRQVGHA